MTVMTCITFEPSARTKCHSQPVVQILLATEVTSYQQIKGNPI